MESIEQISKDLIDMVSETRRDLRSIFVAPPRDLDCFLNKIEGYAWGLKVENKKEDENENG